MRLASLSSWIIRNTHGNDSTCSTPSPTEPRKKQYLAVKKHINQPRYQNGRNDYRDKLLLKCRCTRSCTICLPYSCWVLSRQSFPSSHYKARVSPPLRMTLSPSAREDNFNITSAQSDCGSNAEKHVSVRYALSQLVHNHLQHPDFLHVPFHRRRRARLSIAVI